MVAFIYKSIVHSTDCLYVLLPICIIAYKYYCLQLDCLKAFLHKNKNFRNGVTFVNNDNNTISYILIVINKCSGHNPTHDITMILPLTSP